MTLKEKIDALNGDHGLLFDEDMDEGCINFYYREMVENDQDLIDADDYAMLNSILRYDIGRETARELSRELWEQDVDTMELDSDLKSKILIQKAAERCGIKLDWSKWIRGALDAFEYFPE